ARLAGRPVHLTIERIDGRVAAIDILVGVEPGGLPPAFTVAARDERRLGVDPHPPAPASAGRPRKTGDQPFDERFRVHDLADHTAVLFDDGLRARATASLDGWLAYWPGRALRHRVHPGRGAPLDHPVPISELAFRGGEETPPIDRMVALLDLVAEVAARAELPAEPELDAAADDDAEAAASDAAADAVPPAPIDPPSKDPTDWCSTCSTSTAPCSCPAAPAAAPSTGPSPAGSVWPTRPGTWTSAARPARPSPRSWPRRRASASCPR